MNDQPTTTAPMFGGFALDYDVKIGEEIVFAAGTEIKVRRPRSSELRGVNITALISRCEYEQIELLGPRVTQPTLHKQHIAALDPQDLVQLGGELVDFLVPKAARQAASLAA